MVNISQIKTGISNYVDNEALPKMQGFNKIVFATGVSLILNKLDSILDKYRSNELLKAIEVFDAEGNIDIDLIADEFVKHVPNSGLAFDFPILGQIIIYPQDVNSIHRYISNA